MRPFEDAIRIKAAEAIGGLSLQVSPFISRS
jgi:hypothetical protein